MQDVARELNLSETAFLLRQSDGYNLRWFAPMAEVDLCGHATLASAHMLFETGGARRDEPIRFYTKSGLLTAGWRDGWIELDFPSTPAVKADPPAGLLDALGIEGPDYVGRNDSDYLIQVASEKIVRHLSPDYDVLKTVPARGVIVTSRSESDQFDFVSRFFCPSLGVPEDPVTGSAHCSLGPFWAERLGKTHLVAYQASPRGGIIKVHAGMERTYLSGEAVTVCTGELVV